VCCGSRALPDLPTAKAPLLWLLSYPHATLSPNNGRSFLGSNVVRAYICGPRAQCSVAYARARAHEFAVGGLTLHLIPASKWVSIWVASQLDVLGFSLYLRRAKAISAVQELPTFRSYYSAWLSPDPVVALLPLSQFTRCPPSGFDSRQVGHGLWHKCPHISNGRINDLHTGQGSSFLRRQRCARI